MGMERSNGLYVHSEVSIVARTAPSSPRAHPESGRERGDCVAPTRRLQDIFRTDEEGKIVDVLLPDGEASSEEDR